MVLISVTGTMGLFISSILITICTIFISPHCSSLLISNLELFSMTGSSLPARQFSVLVQRCLILFGGGSY